MVAPFEGELFCSFCGHSQRIVGKLILGPKVNICNACVGQCSNDLAKHGIPPFASFTDEIEQYSVEHARLHDERMDTEINAKYKDTDAVDKEKLPYGVNYEDERSLI